MASYCCRKMYSIAEFTAPTELKYMEYTQTKPSKVKKFGKLSMKIDNIQHIPKGKHQNPTCVRNKFRKE